MHQMTTRRLTRRRWVQGVGLVSAMGLASAASLRGVAAQAEATPVGATPVTVSPADLADPDGAFLDLDGTSIYYVARGPESGPAVVMLHGLLGSTLDWEGTMDALAGAGYRAIAFDLPPFGLSSKSPDLDFSAVVQAERTIGLLDALGIDQATVIGHSAGGPVAGTIAERYPERVTRLVLVSPAYLGLFQIVFPEMTAPASPVSGESAGDQFGGAFDFFAVLYNPTNDPESPADQARLREAVHGLSEIMPQNRPGDPMRFTRIEGWEAGLLAYGQRALFDPANLGPDGAAVSVPVLLLWGELDPLVPLAIGQYLVDQYEDASLVSLTGIGHEPMFEAPDEFNEHLLDFLAE